MPFQPINPEYYISKVKGGSELRPLGPYAGSIVRRRNAEGALRQLVGDTFQNVSFNLSLDMNAIVRAVASGATEEAGAVLTSFSESLKHRWTRRPGMVNVHQRLGKGAQAAILASYNGFHAGKPSYRVGDPEITKRFAGQRLLRALEDPEMFHAQSDGLLLINRSLLDKAARQWYRLNFGAGVRSNRGGGTYPLIFPGMSGGAVALTLRQLGPSGDFRIPPGVFSDAQQGSALKEKLSAFANLRTRVSASKGTFQANRAQQATLNLQFLFAPGSGRKQPFMPLSQIPGGGQLKRFLAQSGYLVGPKLAQGIRGEGFFDAGLKYLAQAMPRAYLSIFDTWLEDSIKESRGPAFKAGISGPQARDMQVFIREQLRA